MEFDEVVKRRKSVRSFSNKKASWKAVLAAIDAANQGPFAANHNHLHFLIVEDDKMIDKISKLCEQSWISDVKILVVVCTDDANLENIFEEHGRVYSRQQAGAAINMMMLKLADLGINSCWVGAYEDDAVRDSLRIPKNIQVEAIIPMGFERVKTKRKPKKKLDTTLYWEMWGKNRRPTLTEEESQDYRG